MLLGCASSGISIAPGETRTLLSNLSSEYCEMADSFFEMKKYDKAVTYYQKSLKVKNSLSVKFKLAKAYVMLNKWADANVIYKELYRKDKENSALITMLAYTDIKTGNVDEALSLYRVLYTKNPVDTIVLKNYILILLELKKTEVAAKYFEELKAINPESSELEKLEEKVYPKTDEKASEGTDGTDSADEKGAAADSEKDSEKTEKTGD